MKSGDCRAVATGVVASLMSVSAAAQGALSLTRCEVGSDAVCAVASIANASVAASQSRLVMGIDTLMPSHATRLAASSTASLLVLVDVSGSMKGAGLGNLRPALRAFLASLDPKRVAVALAPFESHGVRSRVQAARFGPPSDAAEALSALPTPFGNTGLYSAVSVAASVVRADADRRRTSRAIVLLVTDGINDVTRNDDPGLLEGAEGRTSARQALEDQRVSLFALGVGPSARRAELEELAGPSNTVMEAIDAARLSRTLDGIADVISGSGGVAFVVGTHAWRSLSAGPTPVRLLQDGVVVAEGRVVPPLASLPATSGVLARGDVTQLSLPLRRWRLLAFGSILLLAMTLAILWGRAVPEGALPQLRRRRAKGQLRQGARDAPPRRRDERTADPSERIVQAV